VVPRSWKEPAVPPPRVAGTAASVTASEDAIRVQGFTGWSFGMTCRFWNARLASRAPENESTRKCSGAEGFRLRLRLEWAILDG
jgi:hypothetical protein